jgi:hypothetical protein
MNRLCMRTIRDKGDLRWQVRHDSHPPIRIGTKLCGSPEIVEGFLSRFGLLL